MTNDVLKAIYGRRSIRKYQDKPVPKEVIEQLLDAAVMSPNAMHREPWRFIVVESREKISYLSEKVKGSMKLLGLAIRVVEFVKRRGDNIFYDAPLLVIMTAKKGYTWAKMDCGIAAQTMLLAAYSLGLGSCYIGFGNYLNNDKEVLKELGVPEDHEIIAPLIFGYAADEKPTPDRKPKILNWIK